MQNTSFSTSPRARVILGVAREIVPGDSCDLTIHDLLPAVHKLFQRLTIEATVWEEVSVRTLRYYRQKNIVSEPAGTGHNARYGRRHMLEATLARLAGRMHQWTLEDAARFCGAAEEEIAVELANLVDARTGSAAPLASTEVPRPLQQTSGEPLVRFDLGRGAWLLLPETHPLAHSDIGALFREIEAHIARGKSRP